MKICTIGCGGHASQAHGPAQRKYADLHPQTVLAACCDKDADTAAVYRERFRFERSYNDAVTMLERERPDAVCVILPTSATCEVAAAILERGIPVLIEKPPGRTGAELEELVSAASRGGAGHQVAFNRRYMPILLEARGILDHEMPPQSVFRIDYEMTRCDRRDADFSTTAIHAIDTALFLARSPYRSATLRFRGFEPLGPGVAGIEIDAECQAGASVRLNIQPVAGRNFERICIHAHKKSLVIEFPVTGIHGPGATLSFWQGDREAIFVSADKDSGDWLGFYGETEAFFDAVRHGRVPGPALEECRQQVALMEAIRDRKTSIEWA